MPNTVPTPRIVYRSPARRIALYGLLGVVLFLAVGWGCYDYGRTQAGFYSASARANERMLAGRAEALDRENKTLRQRVAALERSSQIDRQATTAIQSQMKALQDESLQLKEDLAFYRSIVLPGKGEEALRIQNFKLEDQGSSSRYRYEVVLTQALKNDRYIKGVTRFYVQGTQGKQAKKLSLAALSTESLKEHPFRFKYFQNLKGIIELPEGFVPGRVTVEAIPSGKTQKKVERSFDWPKAG